MKAGCSPSFEDGDHLNSFPMSLVAVSVELPVQEVHEVTEVLNSSVRGDPAMEPRPTTPDDNGLLESQGDREGVYELL